MSGLLAWLDDPSGAAVERVGGKGASLARLGAAGFPVPPGFAVTVDAYRSFHEALELDACMGPLLALSGRPTPQQVREACGELLAKLEGAALPGHVHEAICEGYRGLEKRAGSGATFAVRSSGVSEDGAGASFAGLYESYLNLAGADAVAKAVQDCYHCLWHPRAAHYRTLKGVDHRREAMAVVVMETVRSAVSGVVFTLNPVSGSTDEVLINASWGLGEAIVSGLVTPDNYIVQKSGGAMQKDIGEKTVRIVPSGPGTEQLEVPAELVYAQALSDAQIRQVAEAAVEVEAHYGCAMDIEFAFDDEGRFFLLQARPVTTH